MKVQYRCTHSQRPRDSYWGSQRSRGRMAKKRMRESEEPLPENLLCVILPKRSNSEVHAQYTVHSHVCSIFQVKAWSCFFFLSFFFASIQTTAFVDCGRPYCNCVLKRRWPLVSDQILSLIRTVRGMWC